MLPTTVVIFGASGDLTQRKLVPALYNLCRDGLLPDGFTLVGFARRPKSDAQFRDELSAGVTSFSRSQPINNADWAGFATSIRYHQSGFDDPQGYADLKALLARSDNEHGAPNGGNRLFYLATPPDAYPRIVAQLGAAGLSGQPNEANGQGWTRVIIEKPFGRSTRCDGPGRPRFGGWSGSIAQ